MFLGFSMATLEYFPEDLLKKMFNIEFLARLDSQLESMCLHFTFGIYYVHVIYKCQLCP